MPEDDLISKNLTALQQLLTAAALIIEVSKIGSEFTDELLPSCTEQFLLEFSGTMESIALKIGAA